MSTARPLLFDRTLLTGRPAVRAAWLSWTALFVIVAILIASGSDRTVVPAYRDAARGWFAGRDIYDQSKPGHGFLYFPAAAILFAPLAWLPNAACEIAWRLLTIGSFAWGVRKLSTLAGRGRTVDLFPLMTLASMPPALACARNGQSTLIMTAMMMLATADLIDGRRGRAALWLSLGLALKPLALVMILLTAVVDRRSAGRLLLGTLVILTFPFLTQSPHYVVDQNLKMLQMFRASSYCGMIELWAQPFSALSMLQINISESVQTLIRAVAALATLGLCLAAQRRHSPTRAFEILFALSVLYILLFNPRTENNTYAMLGPAIGLFAVPSIRISGRRLELVLMSGLLIVLSAGDEVVRAVLGPGEQIWLKPILGLIFLGYLVCRLFAHDREFGEQNGAEDGACRNRRRSRSMPLIVKGPAYCEHDI